MSIKLFISYAHRDEDWRKELADHLSNLKRQQVIADWHDRKIVAGQEWAGQIDDALNSAQIVLLLISAKFMASDYCHDKEMLRAMERHEAGEAVVIPIILSACDWVDAPFSKLQGAPKDAKPIKSWADRDEAWTDVVREIRRAIARLRSAVKPPPEDAPPASTPQLLHLRCNRDQQQDEFIEALREHQRERAHRPMLCLIHGQRFDCHDDFLARLKGEILPKRIDKQIRDFHWTAPPAPLSHPDKFWQRFDEDWLKTNSNSVADSRARIQQELARLNGPLLVRWQWHSADFGQAQSNGLLNFLKFWQSWSDLPEQRLVICTLALVYGEPKAAAPRWAFWQKAAADPLQEWVAQVVDPAQRLWQTEAFSLKALERLRPVAYHEVDRWCSDDEVKRVRDLKYEVIEFFKRRNDQPVEMLTLTKALKKLLAGEDLPVQSIEQIQKRS